jgi:replication-associated recombination protein RarA
MKVAEKYQPSNLGDVIYPNEAVKTRIQAYMTGALEGNLLLWGPNGTGKTSVADLLPTYIGGKGAQVDTNFNAVLKQKDLMSYLAQSCQIASLCEQKKHFMVFHEFDNANSDLHDLWTAIDKYAKNLMLIITTNDPMRVHKSLRSRCDEIHFPALKARQVLPRIQKVLAAEGVQIPDQQALHYLTQIEHTPDLRKYFAKADELIYLQKMGIAFPAAPTGSFKPQVRFTVV